MLTYDSKTPVKPSYRGKSLAWEGVIKQGRTILWRCGHEHHNRDSSSVYNGLSAIDCAKHEYREKWTD